jgi:hypothetical protein
MVRSPAYWLLGFVPGRLLLAELDQRGPQFLLPVG